MPTLRQVKTNEHGQLSSKQKEEILANFPENAKTRLLNAFRRPPFPLTNDQKLTLAYSLYLDEVGEQKRKEKRKEKIESKSRNNSVQRQQAFEAAKQANMNYFQKKQQLGTRNLNNSFNMLIFNLPQDAKEIQNVIERQPILKNSIKTRVKTYYFTHLNSLESITQKIHAIYQQQKSAFKLSVAFGFVFERNNLVPDLDKNGNFQYNRDGAVIEKANYQYVVFRPSNAAFLIQAEFVHNRQSLDKVLSPLTEESIQNYCNEVSPDTAHILIGVYSMCVKIMLMDEKIGCKIPIPSYISENKNIVNPDSSYNMCFWNCMAYHELKNKRCATRGKELFEKFYNLPANKNYLGFEMHTELASYENKENVGVNIYEIDNVRKKDEKEVCDLKLSRKAENETNAIHLLLYEGHFMYIKRLDTEMKTKFRCNDCGNCFHDNKDLKKHIQYCQNFVKEDKFKKWSQIYEPNRNKIIELNDIMNTNCDFRFRYNIVYDFEALILERKIQISNKLKIENEQHAVSVSLCSNIPNFETEVFIENENVKELFEDMFLQLDDMADEAIRLMKIQMKDLYDAVSKVSNSKEKTKYLKILDDYCQFVPVIGFNSGKYDVNLNIEEFIGELKKRQGFKNKIFAIKNGNSFKSLKCGKFIFLDMCQYLPPGNSLDKFVKAFNPNGLKKSIFPYEFLNSYDKLNTPIKEIKREHFYSKLKNCGISDGEWEEFLKNQDELKWETLKDLLKHYNNLDVKPFLEAILKFRQFFYDLELDMFKDAFSLPALAEKIMFSFEFKDFNENFQHLTIPQQRYREFTNWTKKKTGYITQDKDKKRYQSKNFIPYDEVQDLMKKQSCKCLYCWQTLTNETWTLDRIDNDLGHDSKNCVLACDYCNKQRADQNFKTFMRKKALARYSKQKPMIHLIDEENKICFQKLKANICGGASIVFHRYHEAGKTKIRRPVFENGEWRLGEDGKTVQNITGFDANALYLWCIGNDMPCGKLQWVETSNINEALSVDGFVEVDIETPEELYNKFGEFPVIFKNTEYDVNEQVGETMLNIYNQFDEKEKRKTRKLISSFRGEKVLIKAERLRWLVQQGLVVTRVYGYIKCQMEKPFQKFMEKVSDERRKGDIDPNYAIIADIWKLVGNSAFGRTGMNKNKFSKISYGDEKLYYKKIGSKLFKDANQYGDVYEITDDYKSTLQDIPIQVACSIYDDAKLLMSQFYYDCVDKFIDRSDFQYIEMDTDSAYMALTDSFENLIKPHMREVWEKEKHRWFMRTDSKENKAFDKRKPGLFKPEFIGKAIVALSSKMYYVQGFDDKDKFSCKGIQHKHNTNNINFECYKNIVLGITGRINVVNKGMRIMNDNQVLKEESDVQTGRRIYTYEIEKLGLSSKYDKRRVLSDLISTVPLNI